MLINPVFEEFAFPAGECHVRIRGGVGMSGDECMVTQRIVNGDGLLSLALKVDTVRRMGCEKVSAFIPYMPYARQDRVAVKGEPLSIRVFADLLNSLGLHRVVVIDPHSDVVAATVNRCEVIDAKRFINTVTTNELLHKHGGNLVLVSPDAGQEKKIHCLRLGVPVVQGMKHRDVVTGKLSGFGVADRESPKGKSCLIVDDILDGGVTFVGLAKVLRECGATHVYLACTHGIFSKGVGICDEFDRVFVTDSYKTPPEHAKISGYRVHQDGLFSKIIGV